MMIKLIAFDFGDVLVRDTLQVLEGKYPFEAMEPLAQRKYIAAVHKVDAGKISRRQFLQIVMETLAKGAKPGYIQTLMLKTKLLPPWHLLQKLRKHYHIAILTNNYAAGPAEFAKILNIDLRPFPIINSARIGFRKPHANFYRYALRRLKVKPAEMLFIDDKPHNVTAARRLGIRSFCYRGDNMPELKAFLKHHGIAGL